ncbi:hypothetical protein O9993_00460 [Vibrio lentus]|nr:hypothetical protein [Vibrio lentus]
MYSTKLVEKFTTKLLRLFEEKKQQATSKRMMRKKSRMKSQSYWKKRQDIHHFRA